MASRDEPSASATVELAAPEPDDEVLAARARVDRREFAPLYRRYAVRVYRFCYRRFGSREAAEDATAQVFARALGALASYQTGSFRAWLFAIAHNVVVDGHRARRVDASLDAALDVAAPDPGPEEGVLAAEAQRALWTALAALPEEQREVVELRLADLTAAEIAVALGRTLASVKSAQYRAYARLRRLLRVELYPGETSDVS